MMCQHEIDIAIFLPEEFWREATGLKDHEFPSLELKFLSPTIVPLVPKYLATPKSIVVHCTGWVRPRISLATWKCNCWKQTWRGHMKLLLVTNMFTWKALEGGQLKLLPSCHALICFSPLVRCYHHFSLTYSLPTFTCTCKLEEYFEPIDVLNQSFHLNNCRGEGDT